MKFKLKVGDRVWIQYKGGTAGSYETIAKVGRKWAYFSGHVIGKIELENGYLEPSWYGMKAFSSEEEARKDKEASEAWRRFKQSLDTKWQHPENLSASQINILLDVIQGKLVLEIEDT